LTASTRDNSISQPSLFRNFSIIGIFNDLPIIGKFFPSAEIFTPKEEVFRIKQYDDGFSLAVYTRQKVIHKCMKSNEPFSVYAVLGELSSIDLITESYKAKNCISINILMGPKFRNNDIKKSVKEILRQDKLTGLNRVHIKSLTKRPDYHGVLINRSIFVEDPHPVDENYEWATFVPDASQTSVDLFLYNYWKVFKRHGTDLTYNNIDHIKVLSN